MKKILIVTDASGFVGTNIIRLLAENQEYEIRALVQKGANYSHISSMNVKIYIGDVSDLQSLDEIFYASSEDQISVIHCATLMDIYLKESVAYENSVRINIAGTRHIVQKCIDTGAKLVYISTALIMSGAVKENEFFVDFDPSKVAGTTYKTLAQSASYVLRAVKERGLNSVLIHPTCMIGPFDFGNISLTSLIVRVSKSNLPFVVSGGCDMVDVRDVAKAAVNAMENGEKGECYILSNRNYSMKELSNKIAIINKANQIKFSLPFWLNAMIAPFDPICKKFHKFANEFRNCGLGDNTMISSLKASLSLGFEARPIEETLEDTVLWYNAKAGVQFGKVS